MSLSGCVKVCSQAENSNKVELHDNSGGLVSHVAIKVLEHIRNRESEVEAQQGSLSHICKINCFKELTEQEQKDIVKRISIEQMLDILEEVKENNHVIIEELTLRLSSIKGMISTYHFTQQESIVEFFREIRTLQTTKSSCFFGRRINDILALLSYYEVNKQLESLSIITVELVSINSWYVLGLVLRQLQHTTKNPYLEYRLSLSLVRAAEEGLSLGFTHCVMQIAKFYRSITGKSLVLGEKTVRGIFQGLQESLDSKIKSLEKLIKDLKNIEEFLKVDQSEYLTINFKASFMVMASAVLEVFASTGDHSLLVLLLNNEMLYDDLKIKGLSIEEYFKKYGSKEQLLFMHLAGLCSDFFDIDIAVNNSIFFNFMNNILKQYSDDILRSNLISWIKRNTDINIEQEDLNFRNCKNATFNMQEATPLEIAAFRKDKELISLLLKLGADPTKSSVIGWSLLDVAILKNDFDFFTFCFKSGALPENCQDSAHKYIIDRALYLGSYKEAFILSLFGYRHSEEQFQQIEQRVSQEDKEKLIEQFINKGCSDLVKANITARLVWSGRIVLEPLSDGFSFNINSRNNTQNQWSEPFASPLEMAILRGDKMLLRLIVALGADLNSGSIINSRPLQLALFKCDREAVLELISNGATVFPGDKQLINNLLMMNRQM